MDVSLGIFSKIFRTAMYKEQSHFHAVGTLKEINGLLKDLTRSALKQQLKDVDLFKSVLSFERVMKGL